ncbi:nuclear transport factor 2 family protein [Amnibacterium sp. CER49]|uniref:ester cyclase n=1 Tax=Amnibacterium sp. CER49 TaxID=3039161 RepID=UPI00244A518A|nr:nuclear transport factor 2 family protein [Amnibacterium sp. CER49]MDH2442640.1 nuclear transport factor 2 family protein [Amnibacterium sp. CER49]
MTDADLELIRRWNQENTDPQAIREIVSPDFVAHMEDGDIRGPDGWIEFVTGMGEHWTDLRAGQEEVIASGDLIGERWWLSGKRPDGTVSRIRGITMHRVSGGRLQEDWVVTEEEQ